jgi:hypothetical protein
MMIAIEGWRTRGLLWFVNLMSCCKEIEKKKIWKGSGVANLPTPGFLAKMLYLRYDHEANIYLIKPAILLFYHILQHVLSENRIISFSCCRSFDTMNKQEIEPIVTSFHLLSHDCGTVPATAVYTVL